MDLMAEINEFLSSPEYRSARAARREARARVFKHLGVALGKPSVIAPLARQAAGWNLPAGGNDEYIAGSPLGEQHPGAAALLVVRQAMSEYNLPTKADLRYMGMKRASGHSSFGVDEGLIFVEATLHSLSGARHHVDVPVVVREGRLLVPSILIHNGRKRVMAQSTFDDIIGSAEFKADMPDRRNMFSPPPDRDAVAPRRKVPVINPGMFSVAPSRSRIRAALTGFDEADFEDREAAQKWLAPAMVGLGLASAPGPAQAQPQAQPQSQSTYQYSQQPAPGADRQPYQHGLQRDPKQQSELTSIGPKLSVLMKKYQGDERLSKYFQKAMSIIASVEPGEEDAAAQGAISYVAKSKGPASPELRAVKDGIEAGKLQKRQSQLSSLKSGKRVEAAEIPIYPRADPGVIFAIADAPGGEIVQDAPGETEHANIVPRWHILRYDGTDVARQPMRPKNHSYHEYGWRILPSGAAIYKQFAQALAQKSDTDNTGLRPPKRTLGKKVAYGRYRGNTPEQVARAILRGYGSDPGGLAGEIDRWRQKKEDANYPGWGPKEFAEVANIVSRELEHQQLYTSVPPGTPPRQWFTSRRADAAEFEDEWHDQMPGGLADDNVPGDYANDALNEGVEVELEHVNDEQLATEIAMDHLEEDPDYYEKLEIMEELSLQEMESLRAARRQAFYEPDVTGVLENGSLGKDVPGASNSHLDMAERPVDDMLSPGQSVRLKSEATVRDRGGVAYKVPKGSKGTVIRDVDGANWAYYVRFSDLGFSATVPRKALA